MSTPEKPNDPSSAPTAKLPADSESAAVEAPAEGKRHGLSEQTQKALLAVTSGVALVLSIIALVVAIAGGGDHHGRGDGHGPQGGPHMEQRGGPMMRGPQGGPPQGGYSDQAPGQPGGQQDDGGRQGTGTTTSPNN